MRIFQKLHVVFLCVCISQRIYCAETRLRLSGVTNFADSDAPPSVSPARLERASRS